MGQIFGEYGFKICSFLHQVFAMFNDVAYGFGTYFLYLEWKSNPMGGTGSPIPPPI